MYSRFTSFSPPKVITAAKGAMISPAPMRPASSIDGAENEATYIDIGFCTGIGVTSTSSNW